MSNVSPTKQSTPVYLIDGDMPWSSVFKLTFKFSVAAFVIWAVLAIPLQILVLTATNYVHQKREASQREHMREVEQRLLGN